MIHRQVLIIAICAIATGAAHAAARKNVKVSLPAGHSVAQEIDFELASIKEPISLAIVSPKEGEVVAAGAIEIAVDLKGYAPRKVIDAGPVQGPHVHVIVDNQPYQAWYDTSKPFKVDGLAEGHHTLRVFPSRPWHESIKQKSAFAAVNFYVAKKDGKPVDWKKPLLTFSRPKGEYAGVEGFRVMLDFFVNVPLSPTGYRVRYKVDDHGPFDVADWSPIWLEGLADGEHAITLTLIDRRGKEVPGPYNRTERKIVVKIGAVAGHH